MSKLIITGGNKLEGEVHVSGNKNSALKLLAAASLGKGESTLTNIPIIHDVATMAEIMRELGMSVEGLGSDTLKIDASGLNEYKIGKKLSGRIRTAPLLIAPLLLKFGKAQITTQGGCSVGYRLLSTHFSLLEAMGAKVAKHNGGYLINYDEKPKNRDVFLEEASVTATELGMIFASGIPATTKISDAACEPHIRDLGELLTKMGAKVEGAGTNQIKITGSNKLKGTKFRVSSDHIEAGSWAIAATVTGGAVTICDVNEDDLKMTCAYLRHLGVDYEFKGDDWLIKPSKLVYDGKVKEFQTRPWPGFPTDLMSPLIVLATQTEGQMVCHDWMYEWRLFFVDDLIKMGAKVIIADPHRVVILGPKKLRGTQLVCKDIRAGMAVLIAALCAKGKSEIDKVEIIERGYENLFEKLKSLGADVERGEV
jgi:UDP-N-acetylglucosamine 1-carboxyvinyltransferase